jgi:uncharacterized membrane protein YagU involved in acid resistance
MQFCLTEHDISPPSSVSMKNVWSSDPTSHTPLWRGAYFNAETNFIFHIYFALVYAFSVCSVYLERMGGI